MRGIKKLRVLVVDDNRAELRLLQEAFSAIEAPPEVVTTEDGLRAIALMHHAGKPKPDLVLLDINMPSVSGHDVLRHIKTDDELRSTVVIMFSSSCSELDVSRSYDLHANAYITKPMDLESYFTIARAVTEFWTRTATLPIATNHPVRLHGARVGA